MSQRMSKSEAAETMIEAARWFHQQGWLLGTCGNLSIQLHPLPDATYLVTPSGRDKGRLRVEDFLEVDSEGKSLQQGGKASEELAVHLAIYRATGCKAIYHVHSIADNLVSRLWHAERGVTFLDIEMIKGVAGKCLEDPLRLPIVNNHSDMSLLARQVSEGLVEGTPAVLVYQHGIYAWGDSPDAARRHLEIFEFLCAYQAELAQRGLS